jgi:hypothetical protein
MAQRFSLTKVSWPQKSQKDTKKKVPNRCQFFVLLTCDFPFSSEDFIEPRMARISRIRKKVQRNLSLSTATVSLIPAFLDSWIPHHQTFRLVAVSPRWDS